MWTWHDGNWGGWLAMSVAMVVLWGSVVWIALALLRDRQRSGRDAQDLLDERFALGEIDADEYRQRRTTLLEHGRRR